MADVADVATIEQIAARVAEDIITQVTQRLAEQDQRIDELATTVRLAAASVLQRIGHIPSTPPGDQPPPDLTAACAADPADGPQRVDLDVHGHHVVEYVTPGDDPSAVWADVRAAVASHHEPGAAWRN